SRRSGRAPRVCVPCSQPRPSPPCRWRSSITSRACMKSCAISTTRTRPRASTEIGDGCGAEVAHLRRAMLTQQVCSARLLLVIERRHGDDDASGGELVCVVGEQVVGGHALDGANEAAVEPVMFP